MNYCKELRLVTNDGTNWHIEYVHKTTVDKQAYSTTDFKAATTMLRTMAYCVDKWEEA